MMKTLFYSLALLLAVTLSSCSVDPGKNSESTTTGFKQHSNKTLNVSVLIPKGWQSEVTSGGDLVLRPTDKNSPQIFIMSASVERRMDGTGDKSTSTESYKKYRLSQMTTANIGPELKHSTVKSTLAGHPAFETFYSYKAKGEPTMYVRDIYSVIGGRLYQIQSYTTEKNDPQLTKVFNTVKGSYKLLKPFETR
ncbi:MAG: hypothetical protein GXP30_10820 [Verrucomicrobia bacterium]|nr:hypothetical protein [Verrucomicrobiota bacterium]